MCTGMCVHVHLCTHVRTHAHQPRAPARDCPASTPCHDWRQKVPGGANCLQQQVEAQAPQWAVPAEPLLSLLLLGSAPGLPNHPWVPHGFPSLPGGRLHASRPTEQGNGPQGAGKGLGREQPGEQRSGGLALPCPSPVPALSQPRPRPRPRAPRSWAAAGCAPSGAGRAGCARRGPCPASTAGSACSC